MPVHLIARYLADRADEVHRRRTLVHVQRDSARAARMADHDPLDGLAYRRRLWRGIRGTDQCPPIMLLRRDGACSQRAGIRASTDPYWDHRACLRSLS